MKISVLICTWNRAELLQKTLEQMTQTKVPHDLAWEIVVVNNNCTDHTPAVVESFENRLPIRMVIELEQGLSAARNRGAIEATGELLLWTDDDVLVGERWLEEYARALAEQPEAAVFGGPILPWFDGTPPAWLSQGWREVESAYAVRDLGDKPFVLTASRLPYGANYAIRRSVQLRFMYDTRLGRKGTQMLSGEESHVMTSILAAGHTGLWLPDATVKHFIGADRQTLAYLRRYYYSIGVTKVRAKAAEPLNTNSKTGPSLFGVEPWLIRATIESEIRQLLKRCAGRTAEALPDLRLANISRGVAVESYRTRRSAA